MLETVIRKLREKKSRLKIEREYSKTDRIALSDLENLLKDDIDLVIKEINTTKETINRQFESVGGREKFDRFLVKKTDETLENLDNQVLKLQKIKKNGKFRFKDMYEVYSSITKARKTNLIAREFSYIIKEDIAKIKSNQN